MCRFDRIESNRHHFQPTLHSPPKVMIREIMIHEPSSFLKCGHKLQSIRTIRVDPSSRIDNILCPGALYFPILVQIDFRHFESTAIRVDFIKSTRIGNIINPPSKPRSAIVSKSRTNGLPARFVFRLVESQIPKTNRL